jgi:hypothetical protein
MGWEGPAEMARGGGGGGAGCFPLGIGDAGSCCSGECGLETQESELVCGWGVLGKLASLSVAEVIASSMDHNNSLTLAVSFSKLLPLSGVSGFSSSDT